MILTKKLNIILGDRVSIIGAGGKTTLMYLLAQETIAAKAKCLISTSTKILEPDASSFLRSEYIDACDVYRKNLVINFKSEFYPTRQIGKCVEDEDNSEKIFIKNILPNLDVAGRKHSEIGNITKLSSIELSDLTIDKYDVVLVEADGSKGKRLKGWREYEPVIDKLTTRTILVQDISYLNKRLEVEQVFNPQLFAEQFMSGDFSQEFSLEHIRQIINFAITCARGYLSIIFVDIDQSIDKREYVENYIKHNFKEYL